MYTHNRCASEEAINRPLNPFERMQDFFNPVSISLTDEEKTCCFRLLIADFRNHDKEAEDAACCVFLTIRK
ncbi:MAG: hypothetical protein PVF53_22540 [Desulfobacterales bacterium]